MRLESYLAVLICSFSGALSVGDNDGYNLWFTTNKEEKENHPIYFDKPLPTWLRGTYIRNGPGQFEIGKRKFVNALDGFAKLMSWKFPGNGSAYFTTKFLRSQYYQKSISINDVDPYLTLGGVEPGFDVEQLLLSFVQGIDNTNVNVYNFSNTNDKKLVALTDAWNLNEIDPLLNQLQHLNPAHPTLNSSKPILAGIKTMSCAHPLPEFGKNSHISFYFTLSLTPGVKHRQTVVRVNSVNDREAIAEWELEKISLTHSFTVTQNYVIFFNAPYYANPEKLVEHGTILQGMDWKDGEKTDVYLVHIATGKVKKIQIDTVVVYHHINAYELDDGRIVTDVSAHIDPFFSKAFTMSLIMNTTARRSLQEFAEVKRYIFDINNMTSLKIDFQDPSYAPCASKFEVPTINELYRSKEYCFVYGVSFNFDNKDFSHTALVKKDVCNKGRDRMLFIPNNYPSEAWFVPIPTGVDEDDGILMSVYLDGENNVSYLAIHDAKTLNITHTATLPTFIPFNFHGRFFPNIY